MLLYIYMQNQHIRNLIRSARQGESSKQTIYAEFPHATMLGWFD